MQKVKWFFFAYLAFIAVIIGFIAITLHATPPRDPGTLYLTYGATIKTLDPASINDEASQSIAGQIYECLYNYQYKQQSPYKLIPELAVALPTLSKDNKTVMISIRKGIHFYDPDHQIFADGTGPEIKAQDFIYSWKRVADFNIASPLYTQLFKGRIVGLDDWYRYTQKTPDSEIDWEKPIKGLTALDDYTLRIELTVPFPQLEFNLAYGPTAAVCRKAVEFYGSKFARHPIGSGAYALSINDYLPQQRMTLRANPIYRGAPDVDGGTAIPEAQRMPHIKKVEFDYFIEPLPVWLLFQQGLFDVAGIPKDWYAQAIRTSGDLTPEMEKKGIVLIKSVAPETYYYGFNMKDPVVGKNKALRQAISMAYDRDAFIRIYLNGRGKPAIGPIPPGFPTFDPNQINRYTQYNLDAAREKMKEAELINDGPIPTLQFYIGGTSTDSHQEGEFFKTQMQKIGLNLEVKYCDWTRFQEVTDNRQAQIFAMGWQADYPDEQDFLQLFYGKNAGPGNSNPSDYINPAFDILYEKAIVMPDSPERAELYKQMQKMVMEDCPWLLLIYPIDYGLHYNWLGNTFPMNYGYGMRQYLTLDSALREKEQQANNK